MAQLVVRNLEESVKARLQRRARRLIARGFAAFAHQLIESRHELVLSKKENAAKNTEETEAEKALNTFPKLLTNAPAKGRDFGLAHTHGSVETTRASGPAPGRTLHMKSGSTGAEGQLAKNLYEDNTFGRRAVKCHPLEVVAQFEHRRNFSLRRRLWRVGFLEGCL